MKIQVDQVLLLLLQQKGIQPVIDLLMLLYCLVAAGMLFELPLLRSTLD
jgi:hypothetical protein